MAYDGVPGTRRAIGPDEAGVEAVAREVDAPLVDVEPAHAAAIGRGQVEHSLQRRRRALLALAEAHLPVRVLEVDDAARFRQPDGARYQAQEIARQAGALVGVGV